jgi:hypothetical protein
MKIYYCIIVICKIDVRCISIDQISKLLRLISAYHFYYLLCYII